MAAADGGFSCGGWRAAVDGSGRSVVTGSGAPMDGLRALCAAAWSAREVSEPAAAAALAELGLPHPLG